METIHREFGDGLAIELVDYYPNLCRNYKQGEKESYNWLVTNAQPDWISIDVGAHVGTYSILLASLCPLGQVYSFEANKDTYQKLQRNLIHNNVKVKTFCIAVGDETSDELETELWFAGKSVGPQKGYYNFITLDDFVTETKLSRIDFIKIDVDGWDYEVLCGARKTIKRFKPVLIVEVNKSVKRRGHNARQFIQYFYELGYWVRGIDHPSPGNWLCLPDDEIKGYL